MERITVSLKEEIVNDFMICKNRNVNSLYF